MESDCSLERKEERMSLLNSVYLLLKSLKSSEAQTYLFAVFALCNVSVRSLYGVYELMHVPF